ncbi:hypothetical protein [Shewanella sp. Isolate11]|uniref:hypothetical protein n=1 Tax=Shewanella sp. Isolate11 TaxID=2908530 RepID=UPI001EFE52F4|nr:hypothetical protein [Shewanella sp. Isolate11]MCG9697095.1 hypothetical protein [Shewanella sp. Isolate11]
MRSGMELHLIWLKSIIKTFDEVIDSELENIRDKDFEDVSEREGLLGSVREKLMNSGLIEDEYTLLVEYFYQYLNSNPLTTLALDEEDEVEPLD